MSKDLNLREKLRQALESTARVISDDYKIEDKLNENKSSKKFDFFQIENLNSKNDFIKARAEFDSAALKKNFQILKFLRKIYQTNRLVSLYTLLLKR